MIKNIAHIGLTVMDLDRSVEFYRDTLGLDYKGFMYMEGESTDRLFNGQNIKAKIAYLSPKSCEYCPDVELIEFERGDVEEDKPSLFKTTISELCFGVEDIEDFYNKLIGEGVEVMSQPQVFDSSDYGFGKSKAFYFYDPDGNILEAIESLG